MLKIHQLKQQQNISCKFFKCWKFTNIKTKNPRIIIHKVKGSIFNSIQYTLYVDQKKNYRIEFCPWLRMLLTLSRIMKVHLSLSSFQEVCISYSSSKDKGSEPVSSWWIWMRMRRETSKLGWEWEEKQVN